jgi:hypothetical protein
MSLKKIIGEVEKEIIRAALRRWEENTCLEFLELNSDDSSAPHYLKFTRGQGLVVSFFLYAY